MLKIIEEIAEVKHWPDIEPMHVKCKVSDLQNPDIVFETDIHKTELKLIKMLTQIQKGAGLYSHTMIEVWKEIEEYGSVKYNEGAGSNDAL